MFTRRRILLPWLLSAVMMFILSYVWHGVLLYDLAELRIPLALYMVLAGIVYLLLGLALTVAVHQAIAHKFINLKSGFPLMSALAGAVVGFLVFLVVFIMGMSFTKHGMEHVIVDIIWQMLEQGIGGLMVSFGIIYDLQRNFIESER